MRGSENIWHDFYKLARAEMTLDDFKSLGYSPDDIKNTSTSFSNGELLHLLSHYTIFDAHSLDIARFLINECGCDPMAKSRRTVIRGVTSPNRSVFLDTFCVSLSHFGVRHYLEMGIRWLPDENDALAKELQHYREDVIPLYLDYGLCITDKTHPHYPLYTHRLGTRAMCVALLSTWKTRCPLARLLGRDVLALVAKMMWSTRFTL